MAQYSDENLGRDLSLSMDLSLVWENFVWTKDLSSD